MLVASGVSTNFNGQWSGSYLYGLWGSGIVNANLTNATIYNLQNYPDLSISFEGPVDGAYFVSPRGNQPYLFLLNQTSNIQIQYGLFL